MMLSEYGIVSPCDECGIEPLRAENEKLRMEVSELRAARIAYASEFPATADGIPDTGSIHENIRMLKARSEKLVAALEEIRDPIQFMKERLEEGERLNGVAALQLAEDASYLRGIAWAALFDYHKEGKT